MIERLRHRVIIQQPTVAYNSYGEPTTTWSTLATVWASIKPIWGMESKNAEADQLQSTVMHDIRVRFREDVTPLMRITYSTRTFDIEMVTDPDGRRELLQLQCREVL